MPDLETTRTVLELDLASYADVARVLEENLNVGAVKAFEDQIQSFVDRGLESVGLRRADVVLGTAGDNAILIFDRPEVMHQFARFVQEATVTHNESKTVDAAKRWFRMGAATGPVLVLESERRIVGSTVARAVRLEAAAEKGELVVDLATYNGLPQNLKTSYGEEETIRGKRDETFRVRRSKIILVGGVLPQDDASAINKPGIAHRSAHSRPESERSQKARDRSASTPAPLNIVANTLRFKVDSTDPPYTTLTLHVDQPLFEHYPSEWFRRDGPQPNCPEFLRLPLLCPGVVSVCKQSPYEILAGKADLAEYNAVVECIEKSLRTATNIQHVMAIEARTPLRK